MSDSEFDVIGGSEQTCSAWASMSAKCHYQKYMTLTSSLS